MLIHTVFESLGEARRGKMKAAACGLVSQNMMVCSTVGTGATRANSERISASEISVERALTTL
ncbi:hypothetical protein SAMN05216338_102333 [Bradyrhizobium sp. Rc2d]|uniref:hypothetical protein n=1 Tax=Bradyrhizobium sp. Rc2d TaxID=1855321 RepID=UPI0008895F2B|nr:hypothetical protein [Bradyrhizobium sp. Rc2d]SDI46071.1 hypothetical protein SAMN05216338_102333 [Bradyrhizobium sp. Rc2d]